MDIFSLLDQHGITYTERQAKLLAALNPIGTIKTGEQLTQLVHHRFSCDVMALRQKGVTFDITGTYHKLTHILLPMVSLASDTKRKRVQTAYYASPHWKAKRQARLAFDGFSCCNCKKHKDKLKPGDLQVHHFKYDLFQERLGDIMTLCRECHRRMHDNVTIAFPKKVPREWMERLGM